LLILPLSLTGNIAASTQDTVYHLGMPHSKVLRSAFMCSVVKENEGHFIDNYIQLIHSCDTHRVNTEHWKWFSWLSRTCYMHFPRPLMYFPWHSRTV